MMKGLRACFSSNVGAERIEPHPLSNTALAMGLPSFLRARLIGCTSSFLCISRVQISCSL